MDQIESSVKADFTNPKGTFYFSKTKNVRSTTRTARFADAIRELEKLGHKSQVIGKTLPSGRKDIFGLTIGTPKFDFAKSNSKFMPGAIGDNLTSFGGVLKKGAGQTPLTAFLKFKAAGA